VHLGLGVSSASDVEVVRTPLRNLEVVLTLTHVRLLRLWKGRGALLWNLVEVCEDWMGHKLWPEPQDRHTVRVEFGNDLYFWSQEAEVVPLDKSSFVLLISHILLTLAVIAMSNVRYGRRVLMSELHFRAFLIHRAFHSSKCV
jgi:hypothetical protein